MYKVFIDGSVGTTGLKIFGRLKERKDLTILTLPEDLRKDINARKEMLNTADVVFLCLPDDAAREAVSLIENKSVKVIDTSTAHRVTDGWVYGFAELKGQREKIAQADRIANPGCHASGVISLIEPLVRNGLIKNDVKLSCVSLTGYTGGGKKMIAEYESDKPVLFKAPRLYGIAQTHKHLPEIVKVCGLKTTPCLCPIVADYPQGMEVTVPLFSEDVNGSMEDVKNCYKEYYDGKIVKYVEDDENGFMSASAMAGKDGLNVSVYGNADRILLVSRFDNLGKGASGAAIQNMNIALNKEETEGLIL